MRIFFIAYAAALVVMGVLDGIWFSLTVSKIYRPGMGGLMADKPFIPAAVAFYLLYIAGLTFLVVLPAVAANQFGSAVARGAVLGLMAYATYDLTNLAIIRGWPVNVTLIDLVWGTLLTAVTAGAAFLITARWVEVAGKARKTPWPRSAKPSPRMPTGWGSSQTKAWFRTRAGPSR